ncbi:molybdenum cofactor cytidylyltransferase [Pseudoalteromonas sp. BSi20652]|uniref:nucleotidyltransferase family protein n=1 Tax=Pseudoalteromonas sp. BSi20652 TaxID=388384 RepID=UPI000231A138|nr:nucleotidyltransferase family protein [Pseudoalteromonas sp. BSi20652]GAA61340.1 molybdenum cofactor cytidylyltransferase [Pseudoalteromonas sp. BSi20652]
MLIAKVVLAAGQSSRFNGCKLTADVGAGQTMIERAVNNLQALDTSPVFIVTGAWHQEVKNKLKDNKNIKLIENKQWGKGLGDSIATATKAILKTQQPDGILFILADQVELTTQHLNELVTNFKKHPSRWCANYGKRLGVPAIFPNVDLSKLCDLTTDKGAQHLLRCSDEEVNTINLKCASLDIDTQAQLNDFLSKT